MKSDAASDWLKKAIEKSREQREAAGAVSIALERFIPGDELDLRSLFARIIRLEHQQGVERIGCAYCSTTLDAYTTADPSSRHPDYDRWIRLSDQGFACPKCAAQHHPDLVEERAAAPRAGHAEDPE